MSHETSYRFIGRGLYSLPDAERLTRIPRVRIRRWMEGYHYVNNGQRRSSRPIIQSDIGREVGELALTFADLMEIRFLDDFRKRGVSWRSIRIAAHRVRKLVDSTHPFSNKKFKTDGETILAEITQRGHGDKLLDLVRNQWEITSIVTPTLFEGIEFNHSDDPTLWWPLKGARVIIDPQRAFGAPIVVDGSVQTRVLASAAKAEGSQRAAAEMFRVSTGAVRDAIKFESRFAA